MPLVPLYIFVPPLHLPVWTSLKNILPLTDVVSSIAFLIPGSLLAVFCYFSPLYTVRSSISRGAEVLRQAYAQDLGLHFRLLCLCNWRNRFLLPRLCIFPRNYDTTLPRLYFAQKYHANLFCISYFTLC